MRDKKGICDDCGSSDACVTYEDGHSHCFSCGAHHGTGGKVEIEANKDFLFVANETVVPLLKRGITLQTAMKWGVTVGSIKDDPVIVFNYSDKQGKLVAKKTRNQEKEIAWHGTAGKSGLYGRHLWKEGGKYLVITEGEIDAMSVSQANGLKWPVVSIPNGAQGAWSSIRKDLEWVESFEKVIIMFDNDTEGQKAALDVAERLRPGAAHICILPMKDANDMLVAGKSKELETAVFNAPVFVPDGIKDIGDFSAEDVASLEVHGIPWPYPQLNEKLRSLRQSRLYTLAAKEKSGKTTFTKELALHFMNQPIKVGLIYLEESATSAAVSLYAMQENIPMCDVEEDLALLGGPEKISKGLKKMSNKGLYIYDHKGRYDVETLRSRLRYMALGLGCDLIILDNLSISIAGMDGDERRGIDKLVSDIVSLVEETKVSIINVVHLVKNRTGQDGKESKIVESKDIFGSGSLAKFSNAVLAIEPYSTNTIRLKVLSNRDGGRSGYADVLKFNETTGRLTTQLGDLLAPEGADLF